MKSTLNVLLALLWMSFIASCSKNGSKPNQNSNNNNSNTPKTGVATLFAGNGQGGTASGVGVASFAGAYGIVMDNSGNLFVSDYMTTLIRKVTADGTVTTFAGNTTNVSHGTPKSIDGAGTLASFTAPAGMAIDGSGNIYVADKLTIRKITPAGVVTTVAGSSYFNNSNFLQVALDKSGNIYASDSYNSLILKIGTDGTPSVFQKGNSTGIAASIDFHSPEGLTFDESGNLFLVDAWNMIREISNNHTPSIIAGTGTPGFVNGTSAQASFFNPVGILRDPSGNLFVSDYGNRAIREALPNGNVSTVVLTNDNNSPNGPSDMVFDPSGNIFVAEGASILKITLH